MAEIGHLLIAPTPNLGEKTMGTLAQWFSYPKQ
jgi:hypothetical protein